MDIDAFTQCLAYVQTTTSGRSELAPYLGIIGTVLGTVLGFGLNYLFNYRKDKLSRISKQKCCEDDIHELMSICEHSLREIMKMAADVATKQRPTVHRLPSNLNLILLEKYYPDIAHSFSTEQRYWIKLIFRHLEDMNAGIKYIIDSRSEKSLFKLSINLVNLQTSAFDLFQLCKYFLDGEKSHMTDKEQALLQIGVSHSAIFGLSTLAVNIERNDEMLGLDKDGSHRTGTQP